MKLLAYTFVFFLISSCSGLIQKKGFKEYKSEVRKTEKYKKSNANQRDLLYLNDLCIQSFPEREAVFTDNRRHKILDSLYDVFSTPISANEFNGNLRYYLAQFDNQHTSISGLTTSSILPYALHPNAEKWYLYNIGVGYDTSLLGQQLVKINETPIEAVEKRVFNFVFAENTTSKRSRISEFLRRPDLLKQFGVIDQEDSVRLEFENGHSVWIKTVRDDNELEFHYRQFENHPITAYSRSNYNTAVFPDENYAYFQFNKCFDLIDAREAIGDYVKPWIAPFAKIYLNRLIKKGEFPENNIGFKIDAEYPVFRDYLAHVFDSINASNTEHLIIDLRNNAGGSPILCLQLLYHLTHNDQLVDFTKSFYTSELNKQLNRKEYKNFVTSYEEEFGEKPENGKLYPNGNKHCDSLIFEQITNQKSPYYIAPDRSVFDGKIILLVNDKTGSAAALFAGLVQDNNLATVIGTTVGNNPIGATIYQPYKLPESGFTGSCARGYVIRPEPENGKLLIPDYWIEPSAQDLIEGQDPSFDKALEIIKKGGNK